MEILVSEEKIQVRVVKHSGLDLHPMLMFLGQAVWSRTTIEPFEVGQTKSGIEFSALKQEEAQKVWGPWQ